MCRDIVEGSKLSLLPALIATKLQREQPRSGGCHFARSARIEKERARAPGKEACAPGTPNAVYSQA